MQATEREELRRKLEKATKGPWVLDTNPHYSRVLRFPEGPNIKYLVADCNSNNGPDEDMEDKANAAFIAAAREAMPELLADLDASEEANAVLVKALEFYANGHNWDFCLNTETGGRARYLTDGDAGRVADEALAAAKAAPHALRDRIAELESQHVNAAKLADDFRNYLEKTHSTVGGHFDCDECSMIAELTGIVHDATK